MDLKKNTHRRFAVGLALIVVLGALAYVTTESTEIVLGLLALLLMCVLALGAWLMGQVEQLTGEPFSLHRIDGMAVEVSSSFGADDVRRLQALTDEYGEMGQRMGRSLKMRDDESRILELIAADTDRLEVLNEIALMLVHQAPACRFRFGPVELVHTERSDRTYTVTEPSDDDSGWVLQAVTSGMATEPDPDVVTMAVELARLTLVKARARSSLQFAADHDALTGLLSRRAILGELERSIDEDSATGLIYGDVDYFKSINDRLGHLAGDELLKGIAFRLQHAAAESTLEVTVGRLGGDEYLCVLASPNEADVRHFVEQVGFTMNAPFEIGSISATASMSWGAAHHLQGNTTSADLLREADVALYQVKRHGRNSFRIFDDELREWTLERKRLESDLQVSIMKRSGVHADYQPQFDAQRRLVGFEALGRWYRQGVGPVAPDEFIPVAVERGLMADFDHEMYRHVSGVLGSLRREGQNFGTVSINVSAEWLEREDFVSETLSALRTSAVDPKTVVLEITESSLLRDLTERGQRLQELRRWGLRIAIDDFGTGYSSLSYLRALPVDILKLDKEFVADVDSSSESRAIVSAILDLATALNLEVVAEGVEREGQFQVLAELGCNTFQGFLLARPLSFDVARELATRTWPVSSFSTASDWESEPPSDASPLSGGTGKIVFDSPATTFSFSTPKR